MTVQSHFFRRGSTVSKILRILDRFLGFLLMVIFALCVAFFVMSFLVGLVLFVWTVLGLLLSSQDSP
jgi:uncharacterized membrane protein YccC